MMKAKSGKKIIKAIKKIKKINKQKLLQIQRGTEIKGETITFWPQAKACKNKSNSEKNLRQINVHEGFIGGDLIALLV